MRLVKIVDVNGEPDWLNPDHIVRAYADSDGDICITMTGDNECTVSAEEWERFRSEAEG